MKLRTTLSLALAFLLLMTVFTGCSAPSAQTATTETATEAPAAQEAAAPEAAATEAKDVFKVAFLPTDMSMTFASWLASELQTAFAAYDDMELTIIDSRGVLQDQISAMETCVAQGYDYVILLPIEPAAEDDIVAGYIEQGTPFMMINLDDFGVEKASSVIANPYDLGTVVSQYALTLLPTDANVVILLGPSGNTDSIERRRAYEELVLSKNPGITILDEQIGNWSKAEGMTLMEGWLQVYGDKIDAVLSMNDAMAIGAYEAAKDAGLADKILFFGVDGLADAVLSIKDGGLTATALQDAMVMAQEGARIAHEVLTGTNTAGFEKTQIAVTLINKDNVDSFIERYTANGMIK